MKLVGFLLSLTTGLGVNAQSVDVKLMNGDTNVVTATTAGTDEAGEWTYDANGCPGRVYFVATYQGQTRRFYGASSFPRPGGWTDEEYLDLFKQLSSGILGGLDNELNVVAPTVAGRSIAVDTGAAVGMGQLYRQYTKTDYALTANASGVTRTDGVFVRFTRTGVDKWKSEIVTKPGSVTETHSASTEEVLLASVACANGYTAVVLGDITSARTSAIPVLGSFNRDNIEWTGRMRSAGSTPSVADETALGSGATTTIEGTDDVGRVILSAGTGPTNGKLATITFHTARDDADYAIELTPCDDKAAAVVAYPMYSDRTTTTWAIRGLFAPTASVSHRFFYRITAYAP